MLASIDSLSAGRLTVGVGVGWSEGEFDALGYGFSDRGARTDEILDLWRVVWRDDPASFTGEHYSFTDLRVLPQPAHAIPIWVGGWGEKVVLRDAAKYADGWNTTGSPETLAHKAKVFRRHCEDANRDFDAIEKSIMHLGLFESDDSEEIQRFLDGKRVPVDYKDQFMVGTHEQMRETIARYIELGFTHFVCQVPPPYDYAAIERWYTEVALAFKAAA